MKTPKAIIVAYAADNVIGLRGAIPWLGKLPIDMKRLRGLTMGNALIMGLNTFKSIGRPLPGRQNIVLAPADFATAGIDVAHSLEEALDLVEPGRDTFIFGGSSVYAQTIDLVDAIYATEVQAQFKGDAFFPQIDPSQWRETERQHMPKDAANAFDCDFVTYERI